MIKYGLSCNKAHDFEAWFKSSKAFDLQLKRGDIACPDCGSSRVEKRLTAPAILKGKKGQQQTSAPTPEGLKAMALEAMNMMKKDILANTEDVGTRFAEEARRIHFGEAKERGIRGEATIAEARELAEDGVPFGAIPKLPSDCN